MNSPSLALFLGDDDPQIVEEAARAIYDQTIEGAMPKLADLIDQPASRSPMVLRRILAANFRIGGTAQVEALVSFAADKRQPNSVRIDALTLLGNWERPPDRDFVTGAWRPIGEKRDINDVIKPLAAVLDQVLDGDHEVRLVAARLAANLRIEKSVELLTGSLQDTTRDGEERASALLGLANFEFDKLDELVSDAIADDNPHVRAVGRMLLARREPENAAEPLWEALRTGTTLERQLAIKVLSSLSTEQADKKLAAVLELMLNDKVPESVRLEIRDSAMRRANSVEAIQQLLHRYEDSWDPDNPLAAYRDVLEGGDAKVGERLFFENSSLQCAKCHRVGNRGSELGPDLSYIAAKKSRKDFVESIAYPNQSISEGFETVVLETKDGQVISGIVKAKTKEKITIANVEGELTTVDVDEIEAENTGKSAMPENLVDQMSLFQLRDIVEYLSTLK